MGELLSPARLLIHRLSTAGALSHEEQDAVTSIIGPTRTFPRGAEIVTEGLSDPNVWLVAEGMALRAKNLPDGRRQILALVIPGELTERGSSSPSGAPHSVIAATSLSVSSISRADLQRVARDHPEIARSLMADEARRSAAVSELATSLGRRTAEERLAYFFYETFVRLRAIGIADEQGFGFPLPQSDVAAAVGLSVVHVNRTLQRLRALKLIEWEGHRVNIVDRDGLLSLAGFNPKTEQLGAEARRRAIQESRSRTSGQPTESPDARQL